VQLGKAFRAWFGEYKHLRRVIVVIVGASILIVGVLMSVLPGPAVVVIPAGLALLATEFVWARKLLQRLKRKFT
jgi:tellurite resistance protein TerC